MSAIPSESTNNLMEALSLCHTSIAATWKLGLAIAVMVAVLSLDAGASPPTSILRGGLSILVFGLVGWGINAVLVSSAGRAAEMDQAAQEIEPAASPEQDAQQ